MDSDLLKDRALKWGLRMASFLVFLAFWHWYGSKPEMFAVAPPTQVFAALVESLLSGELPSAAAGTLYTMIIGYLIAVVVGVVVDHHPVADPAELVGTRGIREQRREVPGLTPRMQHRQPGLAGGVEAARRDLAQAVGRNFTPVFGIDIE